jgi:hypothetical protein
MTLSITMNVSFLAVAFFNCYAECRSDKWHNARCGSSQGPYSQHFILIATYEQAK